MRVMTSLHESSAQSHAQIMQDAMTMVYIHAKLSLFVAI